MKSSIFGNMTTVQMAVSQRRWVLLSISYCVIYFVTIRSQYFDFSLGTSGNFLLGTGIIIMSFDFPFVRLLGVG
jgi:hypothetical protein